MEAVSGAKCETSDGTAWLPRHMFTRRRRQKELHAQNISWYQLTHNRLRLFWDVLGLLKIWSFLGLSFHSFGCRGPNAWWQVGDLATMLLEYARKLGGGIRKLEKLYLKTGNWQLLAWWSARGQYCTKLKLIFTHSLLMVSAKSMQKQQWLLQLKLVCQRKYCSEKVVNSIPHGFNPIQYIVERGWRIWSLIPDYSELKLLCQSMHFSQGMVNLIPHEDKLKYVQVKIPFHIRKRSRFWIRQTPE